MEELKDALKGTDHYDYSSDPLCMSAASMSPEPSENEMSADSLDTSSSKRQFEANRYNRRLVGQLASGSWASLGDLSMGSDSVFLSTASSCSDDSHSVSSHVPFILNPLSSEFRQSATPVCLSVSVDAAATIGSCHCDDRGKSSLEGNNEQIVGGSPLNHTLNPQSNCEAVREAETELCLSFCHAEEQTAPEWEVVNCTENSWDYPEEEAECIENSNSHGFLSTILENSEPSSSASSSGSPNDKDMAFSSFIAMTRLQSSSCEALPSVIEHAITPQGRCQTFPRTRGSSRTRRQSLGQPYPRSTLYPLEPREVDPASFHQLHTVDSSDELQEFLLLESQCMNNDGSCGIATAFQEN